MVLKIQNLAGIINAKLINNPQISQIEGFCFEASKAKRGECFFATNELEAKLAVKNGAYAIVGDIEPFDDEVAFLRINDAKTAILRLIRYFITANDLIVLNVTASQAAVLSLFCADFTLCKSKLENILKHAISAKTKVLAIKEAPKDLSFQSQSLTEVKSIKSSSLSLFYSDFAYNGIRYSLALPSIFVGEFCAILAFFYNKNIEFSIKDFKDFDSFKPVFVGHKNQLVASSNRAFICVKDAEIFEFCTRRLDAPAFSSLSEPKSLEFEKFALINCDYKELCEKLKVEKIEESLF